MPDQKSKPRWEQVALSLEAAVSGPSEEQVKTASALGLDLPTNIPSTVAAVVFKSHLGNVLLEGVGRESEIPEALIELEHELKIADPAELVTGSAAEVSAWFAARYMLMTARGLRDTKPEPGDVVTSQAWAGELRVVSTIGAGGRVFMKGQPLRMSWPNHLTVVARKGDKNHAEKAKEAEAAVLNGSSYNRAMPENFTALDDYKLPSHVPPPEAVRALEELLESGERMEPPFQRLLTQYPSLLAATVIGAHGTYVIPQQRLGAEVVPDFLVLGFNSLGPQWLLVEIEATRHRLVNKDGTLSGATRHAVDQVQDWREWLTGNVAYAQSQLGLYGITNRAPGLVIIGRDEPTTDRQASRARPQENERISIHSWDWLLRSARDLSTTGTRFSDLAYQNSDEGPGFLLPASTDILDQIESDYF